MVAGAVGGNVAGSLMKNMSLGTLWNSVAGIRGGGLGGQVLGMLGMGAASAGAGDGSLDLMSIASSVLAGGIGGGAGLGVVGLIKGMMGGKAS